jgi:hypothetical protein
VLALLLVLVVVDVVGVVFARVPPLVRIPAVHGGVAPKEERVVTGIPGPVHGSDDREGWLAHWPVVRLSLLDAAAGGALQDVSSTDVATVALQSQPLELQSRPEHDGDKVMVVGHGRDEAQLVQLGPLLL